MDAGIPVSPERLAELEDDIEALPTLRSIDLVDLRAVGDPLRRRILAEGRAL